MKKNIGSIDNQPRHLIKQKKHYIKQVLSINQIIRIEEHMNRPNMIVPSKKSPESQPFALYESLFNLLHIPYTNHDSKPNHCQSQSELYDTIESLPEKNKLQQLTKANYFCMLTFSHNNQLLNTQKVLHSCIQEYELQYGSQSLSFTYKQHRFILLMTRFNLFACYLKIHERSSTQNNKSQANSSENLTHQLNQILTQHIGEFHILRKLPQRTAQLNAILKNYQLILFHTFRFLESIAISSNDQEKVILYKRAFERIQRKSITLQHIGPEKIIFENVDIKEKPPINDKRPLISQQNTKGSEMFKVLDNKKTKTDLDKRDDFKLTQTRGSIRNIQRKLSTHEDKHSDKQNSVV